MLISVRCVIIARRNDKHSINSAYSERQFNQKRGIRQNVPVTAVRIWAMLAEVILAEENKNEGCSAREQGSAAARAASERAKLTGRLQDEDPMVHS